MTGEIMYVDGGYNVTAVGNLDAYNLSADSKD